VPAQMRWRAVWLWRACLERTVRAPAREGGGGLVL